MKMPGNNIWILLLVLLLYYGFRYWYFTPSVSETESAIDFEAVRQDGQTFHLSDLKGKYILLDFWGSWCGPCRRKSPSLRELNQYFSEQLEIVSIGVEMDSLAWQKALQKDQRNWPYQVMDYHSNLSFFNGDISNLYGVNRVPYQFLIGPDFKILATNPSTEKVASFLD